MTYAGHKNPGLNPIKAFCKGGASRPSQGLVKPNEDRKRALRIPLSGYPKPPGPFSLKQLVDYMSGDRLVCLLCGRSYAFLPNHLGPVHGVSCDDYRERYGIPWSYGLAGERFKKAISDARKAELSSGARQVDHERMRQISEIGRMRYRRPPPAAIERATNEARGHHWDSDTARSQWLGKKRDGARGKQRKMEGTA